MGNRSSWLKILAFLLVGMTLTATNGWADAGEAVRVIASNDNTRAAGASADGIVRVHMVAAAGDWQPEGPRSPRLCVAAFGEDLDQLVTPAPLIRAQEGSTIVVQVTNALTDPLYVHGLVTHPVSSDTMLQVPPGETREVKFAAGAAGTYHYWATTSGKPINLRSAFESQLGGGFIVDRRGEQPKDRLFVMSEWD